MSALPLEAPERNEAFSGFPSRHTIVAKEVVPRHLASLGSMDAWRQMVRQRAFESLMKTINPSDPVTVQMSVSEVYEPVENGFGRNLVVVCELTYWVGTRHDENLR